MPEETRELIPAPYTVLPPDTRGYYNPYASAPEPERSEDTLPLSRYLAIVRRHIWKILPFVAACVLGAFLISSRMEPIYEATATIDINRPAPQALVGGDDQAKGSFSDTREFIMTQVRLIQSNLVLRPVAEKYDLLAREGQFKGLTPEQIKRARMAPVVLRALLIKRTADSYLITIAYRSTNSLLAATVANAIAKSYINSTFDLQISSSQELSGFMEKQLDELRAKMERSEQALAKFQNEFNVIDPEDKTNILSARLLQLNTEYTDAQADRVHKETLYRSILTDTLAAAQVSGQGESLAKLMSNLDDAKQRFAQIKTEYGSNHPEYKRAASEMTELQKQVDETRQNIGQRVTVQYNQALSREKMLRAAVAETKAEFDNLNAKSGDYHRLQQEALADKKLYEELFAKIKEAGINSGFQNNNIRLADLALPPLLPVLPRVKLNMIVAGAVALFFSVLVSVLYENMDMTLRTADDTSRYLATDVIATLPLLKNSTAVLPGPSEGESAALAMADIGDGSKDKKRNGYHQMSTFEESIRTLRNGILLGGLTRRINSVLITSAGPGDGKTTTAVHLAIAHSEQKKRTLLLDCDLRRPSVHQLLDLPSTVGLSDVLTGECTWREARLELPSRPNLDVIVAGVASRRASDLVGPMLGDLLDEFAKEYDLVILDSPPFHGFAETLQMSTIADGVVIVASAGKTSRKAVEPMLSALRRVQANVIGLVLNRAKERGSSGYNYSAYYYRDSQAS